MCIRDRHISLQKICELSQEFHTDGLEHKCAKKAVELFLMSLANFLGDLSISYFPNRIVLCGDIFDYLFDDLRSSSFFRVFKNKGSLSKVIENVSVLIPEDRDLVLWGTALG